MIRDHSRSPAATRVLRFYPMDDPLLPLEVLLAGFDALYIPVPEDGEAAELPPRGPLTELGFAQAAAWLRAFWAPTEICRTTPSPPPHASPRRCTRSRCASSSRAD